MVEKQQRRQLSDVKFHIVWSLISHRRMGMRQTVWSACRRLTLHHAVHGSNFHQHQALSRALSGKRLKVYYDFLVEYMERLKQSTHYCIFTTRLGWLAHQNKNSKIQIIVYSKSNRP